MTDSQYRIKIPDVDDWREMVKCQAACPVNTDARGYVLAMAREELALGFEISHDPNPLSTVCGRICGAPCEVACRRGDIGPDLNPISIRPIKRVLTERHGPEAGHRLPGRVAAGDIIASDEIQVDTGFQVFSAHIGKKTQDQSCSEVPGTGPAKLYSPVRWSREELKRLGQQTGRKTG